MIPRTRPFALAALGVLSILLVPSLALGHAVVYPRTSTPGAFERYVLRVPNEKDVPTTRIEIRFPAELRVSSFADVPGWSLQILTDSAKRIVGAVWTGTLAPKRFVELPFVAANPKTETRLTWPTYQSYGDSVRVDWTGPEGSKTPASTTVIGSAASDAGGSGGSSATRIVPWIALILAAVSVGLALRRPAHAAG